MTKSTHQVLYVILFFLLAGLYFLHFSSSSSNENISSVEKALTIQPINEESLNIAFVNSDTVSKYYEFAKKIQKTLSTKRSEAEGQIKSKYFAYENLVQEFEKSSPIMGDREKMEKAQKIRLLEQEIMQVEQQLSGQVSRQELELTQGYIEKTSGYMQEIGKTLGYDYVMSYRLGGAMLYANEQHDITTQIINLLNERYESSK
ncbi:OmpH family outer membrane protein [Flavobacteriales bacterium]|jgi:outer membrane protein|nr:OmpH family outer membrane protein [Flavobacteriales bacterium]|tara:strand:- start:722 stop:1330 length:609 start_codon:yes stop_codon:yes gene_type:complete